MDTFRAENAPGFTTRIDTVESEVRAAVDGGFNPVVRAKINVDSTVTDSGNTPTTTLRGGLLLGKQTSDGNAYAYDPDANDGTQVPSGVLPKSINMLNRGTATDAFTYAFVHGVLKASEIIGIDAHAKSVLARLGIRLVSSDPFEVDGAAFLVAPKCVKRHAANVTLTTDDNGILHVATAAVNFTLPTIAHGLTFEFLNTAAANMVITGDNNIIAVNDVAASTITYSTANEQIGARVRLRAIYTDTSTLKWAVEFLSSATATIA